MQSEANPDDYRDSIEIIADEIERDHSSDDDMEVIEWVDESVDSSDWVFKTHKALKTLQYSDNQPEEWQHLVADDASWQEVISVMAFEVMRQDVYAELRDREVL